MMRFPLVESVRQFDTAEGNHCHPEMIKGGLVSPTYRSVTQISFVAKEEKNLFKMETVDGSGLGTRLFLLLLLFEMLTRSVPFQKNY